MKEKIVLGIMIFLIIIFLFLLPKNKYYYKTRSITEDNINILYPITNNTIIDEHINNYVETQIIDFKYQKTYNNLYIDYDIEVSNEYINVSFFSYKENDNCIKNESKMINYNIENKNINIKNVSIDSMNNYDFYKNNSINDSDKLVAFTFDDGPSYRTKDIVEVLKRYNSNATFFVLGSKVKNYPKILNKIAALGIEIGNHTYSHKELTKLKESEIIKEIDMTNEIIFSVTGKKSLLLRPTYGSINSRVKKLSKYPLILWNLDTTDWKYHNSEYIKNKILNNVSDGDIVLMHDTYTATFKAVEKVIPELINRGYKVVSVSEMFYYKKIIPKLGIGYGNIK